MSVERLGHELKQARKLIAAYEGAGLQPAVAAKVQETMRLHYEQRIEGLTVALEETRAALAAKTADFAALNEAASELYADYRKLREQNGATK